MATVDVKTARAILGLTQEAMARRLGVSTRSLQRWEAGAFDPLPVYATKIERAVRRAMRENTK